MAYSSKSIFLKIGAVETPELNEEIKKFLGNWLKLHSLEDGDLLYHYTDLNGLKGILNDRGLWVSHISTLNDPLEIKYGQNLVVEELKKRIVNEDNSNIRKFFDSIIHSVNSFGKSTHHSFVACFCESENLLSQWRAYSNKGGGFSIGFEFSDKTSISFDNNNLENGYKPTLRKVIYDPEDQLELINDCANKISTGVKKNLKALDGFGSKKTDKSYHATVMGVQASNLFLDLILSFKYPAFKEEHEWRLIHVILKHHQPEKLNFRDNNGELIPFKKSYIYNNNGKATTLPLKSIHLGPLLNQESQKSAIELLLWHSATSENNITINNQGTINVSSAGYELK